MSAERNFTDQDYELLSAYLDGALAPDERTALETRLQTDDGLRQELEGLRQTVKLVGSLPAMKAPRNFTLTRDMIDLRQSRWLIFPTSAAFSGITAAAATILILIGAGLFFLQNSASNTSAPSVMQSAQMEQGAQTELAFNPTQTALMSEKTAETAEQEAADQLQTQVSVTAPPMTSLLVTQVLMTAETMSDGNMGSGVDAFASSPDSMDMQLEPSLVAGEISGYGIESATAEEQATEILQFPVPMAATFSPQATMLPPAQPPAAADSAAQIGGNSEPDDNTQTGIAEEGLTNQTNAVISTPSATFGREAQEPMTASAPANSAIIAASTASPMPTATPSPSATLSQTPMPTQTLQAVPSQRAAEPTVTNPTDFAPLIVLAGFGLLIIAIITTFIRRRG
jgi:anti-sigma factor RsiW